jgi:hypothetical protein
MLFHSVRLRGVLLIILGLIAIVALGACTLMGGDEAGRDIPLVAVVADENGLTVPESVPSGIVAFDMSAAADALPARLNEGVTLDQVNEALGQPDPFAVLALVSLLGGSSHTTDGRLIVDLKPGEYVIISMPQDGPPTVAPFSAGDPSEAAAPAADITVDLVDFNFAIPSEIESGPKVWQINNKGEQWHEMAIVKLSEGTTIDDVVAMLSSAEQADGPPPFEEVAFWTPSSPGETGYVTWDLPPGEYTVLCFLPDIAGDMSAHAAHGMVANLTVTE